MNAGNFTYLQYFSNPEAFKNLHGIAEPNGKYLMNYRYAGTSYKNPVKGPLFTGELILLTSGNTVSAASEFAAIAHYNKRAIIIGEETGGCYYGATGGNYINLTLPNSKLAVRIPTIRIFTAVIEDFVHQPKGRGTIPDYEVAPEIKDVLQGRDVQLDVAIKFINKWFKKANDNRHFHYGRFQ
jgi:C-terminal processing protease CtpA/Prc